MVDGEVKGTEEGEEGEEGAVLVGGQGEREDIRKGEGIVPVGWWC